MTEEILVSGRLLLAGGAIIGGILALHRGFTLFHLSGLATAEINFGRMRLSARSIGAVVMITSVAWAYLSVLIAPTITVGADGGRRLASLQEIGREVSELNRTQRLFATSIAEPSSIALSEPLNYIPQTEITSDYSERLARVEAQLSKLDALVFAQADRVDLEKFVVTGGHIPMTSTDRTAYVVKAGDSPQSIAAAYRITLDELVTVNPGVDWSTLQAGQRLQLPLIESAASRPN